MPDTVKTLVVLTPAFPENEDSAWVISQQLMVKALQENFPSIKIIVITLLYPRNKITYNWNGIPVISLNGLQKSKLRRPLRWTDAWKTLNAIRRDHSITGILSFWCGECALVGTYFSRIHGIKHYSWICGQDARSQNRFVRFIRPRSQELIAMSNFLAREFYKNHGIQPARVIHNAIDPSVFPVTPVTRDIDILATGSLEPLKQYPLFVSIVKSIQQKYPGLKAMLCGDGPERNKVESLINELDLKNNLCLAGNRPHREILQYMQRTKIFLHTSNYEGFSTVCLEALYAGAQVISFCNPQEGNIPNWHIVQTAEEMTTKAIELLLSPDTHNRPVLAFSMADSAKAMMQLFDVE